METTHAAMAPTPPPRGRHSNHRRSGPSNNRPRYTNNRGHNPTYHGNHSGIPRVHVTGDVRNFSQRPHHTPQTPTTTMRHGPGPTGAHTYISHHTDSTIVTALVRDGIARAEHPPGHFCAQRNVGEGHDQRGGVLQRQVKMCLGHGPTPGKSI